MIRNIRYTIISTLELIRLRHKSWHAFNLGFYFLASLVAALVVMVAAYLSQNLPGSSQTQIGRAHV